MRQLLQISDKMYCQIFLEVRRPAFNKHLLVKTHQWNHTNNLWILLKVCYHDISPTISRTKSHRTNWVGFSKWSRNRNLFAAASMRQWVVYNNTFYLRSTDFYLQCRLYSNWNGGLHSIQMMVIVIVGLIFLSFFHLSLHILQV